MEVSSFTVCLTDQLLVFAMAEQQLEPWAYLSGKVVMVTGASSGLGREFCLDLGKAGCRIVAAARRVDRLKSLCDEINCLTFPSSKPQPSGPRAVAVELDVCAKGATIQSSVKTAWDAFGRIDSLINNAGIRGNVKNPMELSEEEWNQTIKTNLTGSWLVSKYVCMHMLDANQGGSIINISSIAGLNRGQLPGGVAYAASKAGLIAMTKLTFDARLSLEYQSFCGVCNPTQLLPPVMVRCRRNLRMETGLSTDKISELDELAVWFSSSFLLERSMALELGAHKIRVNSISPGLFKSEITQGLMKKDWLTNVATRTAPLRTFGTSDPALTSLVRYLIHDSSEYVSGNMFIVDAGVTLPGIPIFSSL
ncbi:2,4-dienoyl-CoA reductase, putative isoform 1 [Theobroma cacao]|uniref:2,4-dienoyl-CoA reductase, putative isoform 1 n=1 Tax=Theobroma cacao TaxID=3641 RepID=A0A061EVW6_THECC|nr:2,4-dienoyl-CoA reductase, putative isoform 1 [Theobroma cacao]